MLNGAVDLVGSTVLLVEGQFVEQIKANQQKATYAKGQTRYIQGGVEFVPNQRPKGDFEIIANHG